MILSYDSILENINYLARGASREQVQAASIDVTLGDTFKVPVCSKAIVRLGVDKIDYETRVSKVIIKPHSFILATTKEAIAIPDNMGAWIEGKSSIGRSGLFIQNAGWIAPGFRGEITLELYNANDYCLEIEAGLSIGQIIFADLDKPTSKPYKGRYLNQEGATAPISDSHKTFDSVAKVSVLKKSSDIDNAEEFLSFTIPLMDIPYNEYSINADERIAEALIGYDLLPNRWTTEFLEELNNNMINDGVFSDAYYLAEVCVKYENSGTMFRFKLYTDIDSFKIIKAESVKVLANAIHGNHKGE